MGDATSRGHGVTLLDRQGGNGARAGSEKRLFHLHGLEDGHELAFLDLVALGDGQGNDDGLHGGNDVAGDALVGPSLHGGCACAARRGAQRLRRARGTSRRRVEHARRQSQGHAASVQFDDVRLARQISSRGGLGRHRQIRVVVLGHERRFEPTRRDVESAHSAEVRIVNDVLVDGHRRGHTLHRELGQRAA